MRSLIFIVTLGLCACGKGSPPAPTTAAEDAPVTSATKAPGHDHGHAHGDGHEHGAPHGGIVQSAGAYHIEAVASKVGLMVFLLDEQERELPVSDVTGTVLLATKDGKPPVEAAFEPMGNHLHAMVTFAGPWTAVVTLQVKGATLSARYEGDGVGKPGGHAHDHAAMPEMKLSETVAAKLAVGGAAEPQVPLALTLGFRAQGGTEDLADFEVVHEQKLHTFVVRDDMSFFDHVHPEPREAGQWHLAQTFPKPGKYFVYNDFKSTSAGANVTRSELTIAGDAGAAAPLVVDSAMTKTFGDLKVTFFASSLAVGETMLTYTIADAAGPVTDLEPYLGAFGHLFILKDDMVTMAHAHPKGPEPTKDLRSGPEVAFHTVLPAAGKYKLWAQFQRAGKVVTTEWTVEVR